LNDVPSLVSMKTEDESQGSALSQGSVWSQGSAVSTRSETRSDLEVAFPVLPKNRKDFDSLVPHSKRLRTNDIYLSLIDAAACEDIPIWKLAAYLGKRSAYGCNKEIARQFDNILRGSSTMDVDTSLAIFLKEYCQIVVLFTQTFVSCSRVEWSFQVG
jgi:hypothetical protein